MESEEVPCDGSTGLRAVGSRLQALIAVTVVLSAGLAMSAVVSIRVVISNNCYPNL